METATKIDMYLDPAHTPAYPKFGTTVAKLRRLPRTPENVTKHFEALMAQVRTMHRRATQSDATPMSCPCASGTWHTDGHKILEAVNRQNRSGVEGALAESWRRRTEAQVRVAYEAAMAGKDAPLTYNIYVPRKY